MAVAFSITIAGGILYCGIQAVSDYVSAIYNSDVSHKPSTSNYIQNDKKADVINTVTIRTFDIDWYTLATVDMPLKVLSGNQINFILELSDTSSSTNSIVGYNHRQWRTVCSFFPTLPCSEVC